MKRTILAGLFAGIALFAWESVAHMLLPLGDTGIKALSNEQAVLPLLKEHISEPGFYFFPAPEDRPGMTAEQKRDALSKAEDRWRRGPSGILIIHPNGADSLSARQLLTQLGVDLAAMLLVAFVLSRVGAGGYGVRVLLVTLMGLLPCLQAEVPNWSWYGFPTAYMLSQAMVHVVGFAIGGLLLAKVMGGVPVSPEGRIAESRAA